MSKPAPLAEQCPGCGVFLVRLKSGRLPAHQRGMTSVPPYATGRCDGLPSAPLGDRPALHYLRHLAAYQAKAPTGATAHVRRWEYSETSLGRAIWPELDGASGKSRLRNLCRAVNPNNEHVADIARFFEVAPESFYAEIAAPIEGDG